MHDALDFYSTLTGSGSIQATEVEAILKRFERASPLEQLLSGNLAEILLARGDIAQSFGPPATRILEHLVLLRDRIPCRVRDRLRSRCVVVETLRALARTRPKGVPQSSSSQPFRERPTERDAIRIEGGSRFERG